MAPKARAKGRGGAPTARPQPRREDQSQAAFAAAVALHKDGRLKEAEAAYRRLVWALETPPPRLLARMAQARLQGDDADAAARLALDALERDADEPLALRTAGVALRRLGRLGEAVTWLERATARDPDDGAGWHSLGNALNDLGRFDAAEAALRRALAVTPKDARVLASLALTLRQLRRVDEALAAAAAAIEADPTHAGAHVERGMAKLTLGRLEEGLADYAWRLKTASVGAPDLGGQPWDGGPIRDKTILVYAEQGLGDMIQFARFAPLLAERAARVIWLSRRPLIRLLRPLNGDRVEVVPEKTPRMPFDVHAAAMSVPGLLGLALDAIPNAPYLQAEPERVAHWRDAANLGQGTGFKVGVAWQGKPTSKADVGRSFPLECLAPLAALPGVRLVALQKSHGLDQVGLLPPGMRVETLGGDFDAGGDAFIDTAAVMASLDLIVTADTSIAHLAGALGRPVWVALRWASEWRWLYGREDSPWYPTMRLFRQTHPGDWGGPFAAMTAALGGLLAKLPPPSPRVPVSWGELLDKITILEIKAARIEDPPKRANVARELAALERVAGGVGATGEARGLVAELRLVNETLWEVEDAIRAHEARGDFGAGFVDLARRVYVTNDRRAALKRALNDRLGSALVEEKSYRPYGD